MTGQRSERLVDWNSVHDKSADEPPLFRQRVRSSAAISLMNTSYSMSPSTALVVHSALNGADYSRVLRRVIFRDHRWAWMTRLIVCRLLVDVYLELVSHCKRDFIIVSGRSVVQILKDPLSTRSPSPSAGWAVSKLIG
nr:hypothetical protein CFP56_04534 [Quercus suber]